MVRYCPKCGGEYEDWVETCADCGEKLVETKPEEEDVPDAEADAENDPMELVAIASFETATEATFNKSILETEGINCLVTGESMDLLDWMDNALSMATRYNIKLMVRHSDAEKALEILNSIVKDIPEEGIPFEDNPEDTGEIDPKAQV